MGYDSALYLIIFLGGSALFYYILPLKYRWVILLLISMLFYLAYGGKRLIFLLVTTGVIYAAGLILGHIRDSYAGKRKEASPEQKKSLKRRYSRRQKAVLTVSLMVLFGLLILLKYYGFFSKNINILLERFMAPFSLPAFKLALPLGISFYTLQAVSYLVDVYRGTVRADRNPGRLAVFLCFFPQIVEGPICRYQQTAQQLYDGHRFSYREVTFGIQRILWGMLKKLVIADRLRIMVNAVFDHADQYSGLSVILAILGYTVELYAEFSGGIDIAIGSAQIFGIHLPENFRQPFFSTSVAVFWRRWHICLGAWFRDYLFYPLSLSPKMRRMPLPKAVLGAIPLLVVWIATGLWHGAAWKYLAYGLYYFLLIELGVLVQPIGKRLYEKLGLAQTSRVLRAWQIIRTFLLVNLGMLIFRAGSLIAAVNLLLSVENNFFQLAPAHGQLFGLDAKEYIVLTAGITMMLLTDVLKEKGVDIRGLLEGRRIAIRWAVYYALIFAILIFGAYGSGYAPADFAYAHF